MSQFSNSRRPGGAIGGATRSVKHTIGTAASLAEQAAGGPARLKITLLLAAVLGLDAADKAAISAVADALRDAFHIDNTEIGLLIAFVSLAGAIFTLPIGVLVDRIERKRILLVAIIAWTIATAASGTATSFVHLLVIRSSLGAVTAAAAPSVASLVGDFFPARARARLYGTILGGELVGLGIGFFVSGEISSLADWRWSLWVMAAPGARGRAGDLALATRTGPRRTELDPPRPGGGSLEGGCGKCGYARRRSERWRGAVRRGRTRPPQNQGGAD